MNLLSLIIIFLALAICAAVGYIAWELTTNAEEEAVQPSSIEDDSAPSANGDNAKK